MNWTDMLIGGAAAVTLLFAGAHAKHWLAPGPADAARHGHAHAHGLCDGQGFARLDEMMPYALVWLGLDAAQEESLRRYAEKLAADTGAFCATLTEEQRRKLERHGSWRRHA